ncbi:MAG: hypothetical protein GQ557_00040 [Mycoplasmataceae bacterium]|nr:hypothetical protein [Mycoplasmataceae bacterium]
MSYLSDPKSHHQHSTRTKIILLVIFILSLVSIFIFPVIANPVYDLLYFTLIITFGFYLSILFITIFWSLILIYLFYSELPAIILHNSFFYKVLLIIVSSILLFQVFFTIGSDNWVYHQNIFHSLLVNSGFENGWANNFLNIETGWHNQLNMFGIISFSIIILFGGWFFAPFTIIIILLFIFYGLLSIYSGYVHPLKIYEFVKEPILSKYNGFKQKPLSERISEINRSFDRQSIEQQNIDELLSDHDEENEENEFNSVSNEVASKVRKTINSDKDHDYKNIFLNEQQRLEKLKQEIIRKKQYKKDNHPEKALTPMQKFSLLRNLGSISPVEGQDKNFDFQEEVDKYYVAQDDDDENTPVSGKLGNQINNDFNRELFEIFAKNSLEQTMEVVQFETPTIDVFAEAEKTLNNNLTQSNKDSWSNKKIANESTAEIIFDARDRNLITYDTNYLDPKFKKIIDKEKNEHFSQNTNIENNLSSGPMIKQNCTNYLLPATDLFKTPIDDFNYKKLKREIDLKINKITNLFSQFNVKATIFSHKIGPIITSFEIKLDEGIKFDDIINLEPNLKLELETNRIRIQAPIPGKALIGLEVPNQNYKIIPFIQNFEQIKNSNGILSITFGHNVFGNAVSFDLTIAPHLLIADLTGDNKAPIFNTILASLLMRYSPSEFKLVLFSTQNDEFTVYNDIPHLYMPLVTNKRNIADALNQINKEIKLRYKLLTQYNFKSLTELNIHLAGKSLKKIPYLIVMINELQDILSYLQINNEEIIINIIQQAQAVGIHLIIATKTLLTNIIAHELKTSIFSKISFHVNSEHESKLFLKQKGAEKLLDNADMLVSFYGQLPQRLQNTYISNPELNKLVNEIKKQCQPDYFHHLKPLDDSESDTFSNDNDDLYNRAKDYVITTQNASIRLLQRHLGIRYNKAVSLIEKLEQNGIISSRNNLNKRKVSSETKRNE